MNRQDATSPAADGPEARAGTPATTDRPTALRGVHTIMPTPFTPDGRLDEESLARLTRFLVARGVDGVTVLGFLGEAHKLSEAEQDVVVTVTVQAAGGQVRVEIRDNGRGFEPAQVRPTSLGLNIMRERAETIGAQLMIDTELKRGTRVEVIWPHDAAVPIDSSLGTGRNNHRL